MAVHSGFKYYFDLLGLDNNSYRVHYRFDDNTGSGNKISNEATGFLPMSGFLSPTGSGFYSQPGSGYFTGNIITIMNATGLPSEAWTHIIVYNKTGTGAGVLVDTLTGSMGSLVSGYTIGINDNNRLYFESYDNNGPFTATSSIMLGKQNVVAVTKSNSVLSFYCYDFNNQETLSDNFSINGEYIVSSRRCTIGRAINSLPFSIKRDYKGYLDEYIFLQESITPFTFKYLASGLVSTYSGTTGPITTFSGIEITGYSYSLTGLTGITGYKNVVTGSGLDPFATGNAYEFYWQTVPLSGYLTTGFRIDVQTGYVFRYITGDTVDTLTPNIPFMTGCALDEVSYLRKIDDSDMSVLYLNRFRFRVLNLDAGFDDVQGRFQVRTSTLHTSTQIYINGIAQYPGGFTVTGGFYGSGIVFDSGVDYRLDKFYVDSTGLYSLDDVCIYDEVSGPKVSFTGIPLSGNTLSSTAGSNYYFLNGVLLTSGLDYISVGGTFTWITNAYSGMENPRTFTFPHQGLIAAYQTGLATSHSGLVQRRGTQLFLNGQRQLLGWNYIENSSLDLIRQSGLFDATTTLLYDNNSGFFEN